MEEDNLNDLKGNEENDLKEESNLKEKELKKEESLKNGKDLKNDKKIKDNLDEFKELNKYCKNLGLCLRCQLRYLGELYSSSSFMLSQNELNEVRCN